MISQAIRLKKLSKVEMFIVIILLVMFVSEVLVIFILNHESGKALSKFFASMGVSTFNTLVQFCKWTYKMVGPMLFPFLALTGAEVWAITNLVRCWRSCNAHGIPDRQYKTLRIVEGVAPGFGFLGTCISLIFTMHHMDPKLNQTAMLKVLLENSSSAFGSTVYGLSLAITAFLSMEIFKNFLINSGHIERNNGSLNQKIDKSTSMALIRREE